ncbi:response regulator transcription factor [Niameybacter massiliensis]|uniref:Stage 0 sporulation protein A homolog n=1 Tax=Holtiella tumoricola TaxID=3018743 RepID=A0AA42DRE8_9FIRM|nr:MULTISPECIES: response regulator transcription factor [Lachnospirales]MDA3733746.1 response regulator transcription factor [Holtiella tumoricola]
MQKKIYIADDEPNIAELMCCFLEKEGFVVECFESGESLLEVFQTNPCDLIILDIMLPGIDGLSLCALLRQTSSVPIIMVSARASELDRVTGITIGSDDYIVKPFSPLELVARVKALFRRNELILEQGHQKSEALYYRSLVLNTKLRTATIGDTPILLTPTEFDFLAFLVRKQDQAVSKAELLKELWKVDFDTDTRAADDLVKRLRKKLKEVGKISIETVWGFGYRIGWND